MDRRYFYFKQRVSDDEMRSAFDGPELAMWLFAKDLGVSGIIDGGVVTEHAPNNMTVDMTGPFTCYTQDGYRVAVGTSLVVDVSTDYLGNPTVPTNAGESRWISLHARFDRSNSDPRVDGNGNVVYWAQDESYEIRVISGVAAGGGGHVQPALPTDAILIADIELTFGQVAVINANIDESRKMTFVFAAADAISVDATGWTNIDGASVHVQDALDSVDAELIVRDGTGQISQALIPDGDGTRALGSGTKHWAAFLGATELVGAFTLTGDTTVGTANSIKPTDASGQDLGDLTHRWDVYASLMDCSGAGTFGGLLTVTAGGASITGDIGLTGSLIVTTGGVDPAAATGQALGDATHKWDAFINDATLYGSITTDAAMRLNGAWIPTTDGNDLGSTTLRWDLLSKVITMYGAGMGGNLKYDSARAVAKELSLSSFVQNAWAANTWQYVYGATWGARAITGWTHSSSGAQVGHVELDLPHGATITDLELTWYQQGGGAALVAEVLEIANNGSVTSKGSKTIGGVGSWQDKEAMGLADFVVDRQTNKYILVITGVASQDCALTGVIADISMTDVGSYIL
jgi:hypothetical protein